MTHAAEPGASQIKQCCAALYGSDLARFLLGESFHPGGLSLTHRLGDLMRLRPADRVLDVAAGRGASAFYLSSTFGCTVVGIDLSHENVKLASEAARESSPRTSFQLGDAECLPFPT